jgi:hypothetical protein
MWLRRFRPTAAAWGSAGLMLLALIMVCVLTSCLCALLQCPVLPATASRAVDCPVRCVRSAHTHLEGAHPASHAHQEPQRSQRDRGSAVRQHNAAAAHSSTPHREQHSSSTGSQRALPERKQPPGQNSACAYALCVIGCCLLDIALVCNK